MLRILRHGCIPAPKGAIDEREDNGGMSKVRILGAVIAALFAALAVGCATHRVPVTTRCFRRYSS